LFGKLITEDNMKRTIILIIGLIITGFATYTVAQMGHGMMRGGNMMEGMHDLSPVQYNPEFYSGDMRISRGGQLYDNWWKATTNTGKPEDNHPLWSQQNANKRSGYDTYRCKECHGWDYKGKNGAYAKGSHFTGFKGVYEVSQKKTVKELEGALKGSTNKDHDFSKYLSGNDISDLALYLKKGIINTDRYLDKKGNPIGGDVNAGAYLFNTNCTHMCHGGAGTSINFGKPDEPEFIGTVANKNPWELIHKVRSGQPGTKMMSAIINRWSDKDILDLVAYTRTLPKDQDQARSFGGHMMGSGMGNQQSGSDSRGFGPITK
jgi:mono/diheme cytochrome c family protein